MGAPGAVTDAGGLLVLAGLLEVEPPEAGEVLFLDATSLLVAEYLAIRHEGAPERVRRDFGPCVRVVAQAAGYATRATSPSPTSWPV